jgi:hypothetical protein
MVKWSAFISNEFVDNRTNYQLFKKEFWIMKLVTVAIIRDRWQTQTSRHIRERSSGCHGACDVWTQVIILYVTVLQSVTTAPAGILRREEPRRPRSLFWRRNQVKRWILGCMKWGCSGVPLTVKMTDKPALWSDIWSCVSYVADARAMNARQCSFCFFFPYRKKFIYVASFFCLLKDVLDLFAAITSVIRT